jgi:pimeloyl-[acyl-carrier protein] methyl ester esterase
MTLVLVHGWGFNARVFDPLREPFEQVGIETSCVELPGHGRRKEDRVDPTLAAWAEDCLESLPETPVALLGWSLGGQVALEIAIRNPERVTALILVSTTPRFVTGSDWPHGHDPGTFDRFARDLENDYSGTLEDFLFLQVRGRGEARTLIPRMRTALQAGGSPTPAGLRAGLEILRTVDLRTAVRDGIPLPVLLVAGRRDRLVPPEAVEWLARALSAGTHWFEEAGHAPFLSDPAEFCRVLSGYLADFLHG